MLSLKKLLMRIPDRRIRRWAAIGLFFAISLLVGRVLETVLSKESLSGLNKLQQEWIDGIQSFTPFGLVSGYMGDLDAATRGEWVYTPPKRPEISDSARKNVLAQQAACDAARARQPQGSACDLFLPAGASRSACVVDDKRPGCSDYVACLNSNPSTSLVTTPPECMGIGLSSLSLSTAFSADELAPKQSGISPYPIFIPLVALLHGASRLAGGGAGAIVLAILQVGFGLVTFIFLSSSMSKTKEPGFGNALLNILLGPFVVIGLGSLLALLLQGVMLAALYGLSWVTGLAATAAAATGVGGGCWWCFTKIAEKGVEHTVSH